MPTTTSLTTTYAGKIAGGYIRQAFIQNETLSHITLKENIDYKQVVKKLVDDITFAAPTCDFTPTGTVTITERVITLEKFQVQRQMCKKDFLADWEANYAQNGQLAPELSDAIIANMLAGIAAKNETLIWQGVNGTTGEYDGFEVLMAADVTVNDVSSPEAITSSNVLAKIALLIAELPTAVKASTEKPKIYFGQQVWEAYIQAQVAAGNGWYATGGGEVPKTYMGMYEICVCPGMSDSVMIMAQASNLWFGTNLLNDWNQVDLLDMYAHDLSQNVRFNAQFFAAVQYGIGSEIAAYGLDLS